MADHRDDESFVDKIKGALGMGDERREHDRPAGDDRGTGVGAGTTGVDDTTGTANRPGGPDYGARDPNSDLGSDFEDPRDAGTARSGGDVTGAESEWTRGGAASGESSLGSETDAADTDRRSGGI